MDNVSPVTGYDAALLLLAAAIFISLIIERVLEIIKALFDVLEAKYNGEKFWNKRANDLRDRWESLLENSNTSRLMDKLGLSPVKMENNAYAKAPSISAEKLRNRFLTYAAKVLSITLGIIVAWVANIDMFDLINTITFRPNESAIFGEWFTKTTTGIAMGLGAGPLHTIIARMEQAKQARVAASSLKDN